MFRDVLEIEVIAGKGGDGAMSFFRAAHLPKGGPDGGHGGKGGSVFLRATQSVESLDALVGKRKFKATDGHYGQGRNKYGSDGEDIFIDVPVGTLAIDLSTNQVIADVTQFGEVALLAKGGEGGRGNSAFVSSRRQAPRFAELGVQGQTRRVRLELRLIADVGLVGYPNAGKSSMLRALSNAKPEVAAYPFTTLSPILGVVERADALERFTMSDIPGIIEGAHQGKGLGLEFLRHISRTRLLVYVLDGNENPSETLATLQAELREFDPSLLDNPSLVALNKIDLLDDELQAMLEHELVDFGLPVVCISAQHGLGLDHLRETLFDLLPQKRLEPLAMPTNTVVAPDPIRVTLFDEPFEDGTKLWIVTGGNLESRVSRFGRHLDAASEYLEGVFAREGVLNRLKRAGVKAGDTVRIGAFSFEYFDDEAERRSNDRRDKDSGVNDPDPDNADPNNAYSNDPDDSEFDAEV